MKVKMILPALTEAKSPFWRPIKYSLFPPLGLATLAGYLGDEDEVVLQDEHVETLDLDDEPDLAVIQVYIFLDDHLFGNPRFAAALFDGMKGMGRLWQAAGTVKSVLAPDLLEKAVECGLRSLFVGFETLNPANLREQHKYQNLNRDYTEAIRRLHGVGVMVNGSFVFGMDDDDESVFDRTVEWAIEQGIETATFHILTPYPGTALYQRMVAQGRMTGDDWELFDTRHVVFRPAKISADTLEAGYWRAYREFYRWSSIFKGAWTKEDWPGRLRHIGYAGGWKKFEPLWDWVIRAKRAGSMLPMLETILSGFGCHPAQEFAGSSPRDNHDAGASAAMSRSATIY